MTTLDTAAAAGSKEKDTELDGITGDWQEVVYFGSLKKMKEGKNWKKRWCAVVMADGGMTFLYKKSESEKKPLGMLPLRGAWISTDPKPDKLGFQITPCAKQGKTFFLQAESEKEHKGWVTAVQNCEGVNLPLTGDVFADPGYDGLAQDNAGLVANLVQMSSALRVTELLGKKDAEMATYFEACREQMRDCPFHNWCAAAAARSRPSHGMRGGMRGAPGRRGGERAEAVGGACRDLRSRLVQCGRLVFLKPGSAAGTTRLT